MNEWKKIWNNRKSDIVLSNNLNNKELFLELKRLDGFDVVDGLSYESLIKQYKTIKNYLIESINKEVKRIYEVGCGSGANLFLFENDGYEVGGIDYSKNFIKIANNVLNSNDLICDEAVNLPDKSYDVVFSNSVFSYFPNTDYALEVLKKMSKKAKYAIGLIDIHDITKKEEFTAYRKKTVEDYEKRYKNLEKLFYEKELFYQFAADNNMECFITESDIPGYWNNDFVFNCFLYKKEKTKKMSKYNV